MSAEHRRELVRLGLAPCAALDAEFTERQMQAFRDARSIGVCPAAAYSHAARAAS